METESGIARQSGGTTVNVLHGKDLDLVEVSLDDKAEAYVVDILTHGRLLIISVF
jgi:hypothetical protein